MMLPVDPRIRTCNAIHGWQKLKQRNGIDMQDPCSVRWIYNQYRHLLSRDLENSSSLHAHRFLHTYRELCTMMYGGTQQLMHSTGIDLYTDIWARLTPAQRILTNIVEHNGKPLLKPHPSWLYCSSRLPLDFLVSTGTSGHWAGHTLASITYHPTCLLCGTAATPGGYSWQDDPWGHIFCECDAAADILEHTELSWALRLCQRTSLAAGLYIAAGSVVAAITHLLPYVC